MSPNIKLAGQVFAGLLLMVLGCVLYHRLSTLGWPGDFRSPSNRAVTALGIGLFGGGIFWIVQAILQGFGK